MNFAVSFLVIVYLLPSVLVHATVVVVYAGAATATGVSTLISTLILRILDSTWVRTRYSLHLLAAAVEAGNLDSGICQLVLQVYRWGEHYAAGASDSSAG